MTLFDDAMRQVLAQQKYDKLTGRALDIREILADAARRFVEFILNHLNIRLPEIAEVNTDLFVYIFLIIGAILLLAAVGLIVRVLSRRSARTVDHGLSDLFAEMAENQYSLAALLQLSQERANEGCIREAVRYRFIAALVGINERHSVRIEKSKTNAQLLSELVAAEPSLAVPFTQAIECFHWVWFGYKTITDDQYAHFVQQTEGIIQGLHGSE